MANFKYAVIWQSSTGQQKIKGFVLLKTASDYAEHLNDFNPKANAKVVRLS